MEEEIINLQKALNKTRQELIMAQSQILQYQLDFLKREESGFEIKQQLDKMEKKNAKEANAKD